MKAFFVGVCGAVLVIVIVAAIYFVWDTHRMAVRGDMAFQFIEQQLRQAQQAAPKPPR